MSASTEFLISEEEELAIHRRLMDRDVTAFVDLAEKYLGPLIHWLLEKNDAKIPEELRINAAEDALIALVKSPSSFDPVRRIRLEAYLCMSAQGDLKNALQGEKRRRQNRISLENVELSARAGKYLGVDDDPSLPLQIQEERDKANRRGPSKVRDGLTEGELRFLELMKQGERKTAIFASALEIGHLPKKEQEIIVKRKKDKLNKRMERGACHDDHAT